MVKKKIAGIEEDALIVGGIAVVGYSLLRNSLPSLFGNVSPEDKQTLDDQQASDPGDNIFSSQSQPYVDFSVVGDTILNLMQQYGVNSTTDLYLAVYRQYLDGDLPTDNPLYNVCQVYYQLHSAVTGHLFTGDQDAANLALNMITNKWQLGALAELWADQAGSAWGDATNLFKSIRNGSWPMQYGLNPSDLASQVRRLNNLPD